MRNVTFALVGALVASFVAVALSVYAQTPTAADFAVCNADWNSRTSISPRRSTMP